MRSTIWNDESQIVRWIRHDLHQLHRFFDEKIAEVRNSTADAPPPCFVCAARLRLLGIQRLHRRRRYHRHSQNTGQAMRHWSTSHAPSDMLAPFITQLFNRSLSSGLFPTQFKAEFLSPVTEKAVGSRPIWREVIYRPISNLNVLRSLERHIIIMVISVY